MNSLKSTSNDHRLDLNTLLINKVNLFCNMVLKSTSGSQAGRSVEAKWECKFDWLWVRSPLKEVKYLFLFIFSFLRSVIEANRRVEFRHPARNVESGERNILTLHYYFLPCCVRDTAWICFFYLCQDLQILTLFLISLWIFFSNYANMVLFWPIQCELRLLNQKTITLYFYSLHY